MSTSNETVNRVFEAVSDGRRRSALRCLTERGDTELPELAAAVACRETDTPPEPAGERVRRVYFTLYHTHVPKLERAGLVRYQREHDAVALSDSAPEALQAAASELDAFVE
jgi:hypothetical protein